MPLHLPDLDRRTYEQLVKEAQARIPAQYPEWTDHNPSDPGIILIELFAWLSEMVTFRLNRITEDTYRVFLELLNEPGTHLPDNIDDAIRQTVLELRQQFRAVTCDDYEKLVRDVWPMTMTQEQRRELGEIGRVRCVPLRDLVDPNVDERDEIQPANVSIIVVPQTQVERAPQPSMALLENIWHFLDERRLLTTQHHVVGPAYVPIQLRINLVLQEDALFKFVRTRAEALVRNYLHPLRGGEDGQGWPFGRDVYLSELYSVLENVDGVDYVSSLQLTTRDEDRMQRHNDGTMIGVSLNDDELVAVSRIVINREDAE